MRATVMYGAGDVRVEDVADAGLLERTDALVRVTRAAMGHEFIGVVEALGSDVVTVREGDLVVSPFLLVDKRLRPDRWILFDDMHWSMAASASTKPEELQTLSADELNTAQIERVFEILVRNHPNYGEFLVIGNYGSAYKLPTKGEAHHRQDVTRILGPHVLQQLITRRRAGSLEAIDSDASQLG